MSLPDTLLVLGVGCILAAIVGGGLKLTQVEIPVISSVRRQGLLAFAGLAVVGLSYAQRAPSEEPPPLPIDCVRAVQAERGDGGEAFDVRALGGRRTEIAVHAAPSALVVTGRTVWVAHADGAVTKIPVTMRRGTVPPRPQVRVGSGRRGREVGIAAGAGHVWVVRATGDRGVLAKIPKSATRTREVPLPSSPDNVAVGGGKVWVTDDDARLSRFRLSLEREGGREISGDPHGILATYPPCVYVATTTPDGFTSYDVAADGRIVAVRQVSLGGGADEIAAYGGFLWATDRDERRVLRIDPADPQQPERFDAGVALSRDALAVGTSGVWVAGEDGTVVRIDPERGERALVRVDGTPVAIAISRDPEVVWVARRAAGTIARIEP